MDWFYNSTLYKTKEEGKTKNKIGQLIDNYIKTYSFKADVQPAGANLVKKTFGEDVECNFVVYCDELLNTGDVIVYRDKTYKVMQILSWDYTIAAIKGVDLIVD